MFSPKFKKNFGMLSFNNQLLLEEFQKRKIIFKKLKKTFIVEAFYGKHKELLYDLHSSLVCYPMGTIVDDKNYTKELLKRYGFNVAEGRAFFKKDIKNILNYAKRLNYPVVIKPTVGSHGDQVYLDNDSSQELKSNIDNLIRSRLGNEYLLVEKQIEGREFRLFITKNGYFAAVERIPASVVGDGKNNIKKLIEVENLRRKRLTESCLCKINTDSILINHLAKKHLSLNSVPLSDEKVTLRKNSNISTGGNCIDVTDSVDKSYIKLAKDILSCIECPFIGIDVISKRIDKKDDNYVVCELNSAPGLSLHMMPEKGKKRNVAKALVDVIFPETV